MQSGCAPACSANGLPYHLHQIYRRAAMRSKLSEIFDIDSRACMFAAVRGSPLPEEAIVMSRQQI